MEPDDAGRRHVPLITAILAVVGATLLVLAIFVASQALGESSWRAISVVSLAAGGAILTALLVREIVQRRRTERAFVRASQALERLAHRIEDAPDDVSFPDVLDELARRATTSLGASWASVLLSDEDGEIRVAAATPGAPRSVGSAVDEASIAQGSSAGRHQVPLALEGGAVGVLELGQPETRTFDRDDLALMDLIADRFSVEIERARLADAERRSRLGAHRARSQLALIAEVSIVLARAIEDLDPAMREITSILVDEFADLSAIHMAGANGELERVGGSMRHSTDGLEHTLGIDLPGTRTALQRVLASSRSELTFVDRDGRLHGTKDELGTSLGELGMTSWVIAPIRVRGLPMGTIMAATAPEHRGFRPSDQAVVDEVAGRIAISLERAVLYSEMRVAGVAAEQRAEQMARLIEAAIALNPSSTPNDLMVTLVDQATQVLRAPRARSWLYGDDGIEAELGTRPEPSVRAGSPLVDATGNDVGFLSVTRSDGEPFTAGDDAVLTVLARLASAAVQNARLYDDVRVREQRLQALFEASPLAILELDLHGVVRDANAAARTLFGDNPSSIDFELPQALLESLGRMTAKALAGDVAEEEVRSTVDSTPLDMWVSTAPLRGQNAVPSGVLAVVSDTTERNRLEEQLTDAHRYEAIANLAGGIAHDFNNLLTIILGYSDLLLQTMPAASSDRDDVSAIQQAGQHAAVITNQLLTLSRNQVVQPIVVRMRATCESLVPMLRRLAGDQVIISLTCETDAAIRIDAGQLEQVLFNLVLNSRDAMPEGGEITIRTVQAAGAAEHPAIGLVVSDIGSGMDAETLARCREPFFTTKGRRGIGLGLGTVATIVERAGGRLEIDTELGVGTTIRAIFPIVESVPAAVDMAPRPLQMRVLLVDDDELVRGFASKALNDAGYDVTSVDDADGAFAAATANGGFDLIVSDVVLPGMSGLDLVRTFRERWPATARLLMTGFAGTDTTGTDLEDVQVLKKPFAVDELTRAADGALEQQERQGSNR